ncbi:Transposon Tf2-9 polyprotein [Araneus ventricosus]|uniref:RNA-directed DNA polymerase n=1 Tax=Araneus ventricosus TaxID=182803 RepID=A0A4Y2HAB0_ARAVE|nr:Transposon Tf2-9 polyprotein [Araneus ventricosus]
MFNFLQKRGQKFIEIDLAMCLADGQQSTSTVLKTTVPITVHGRTFRIDLIFLPHAKGNRTLLGVDFLRQSGIVMDMHNNFWYFGDKPNCRVPFAKDIPLPTNNNPVEINRSSCPTNSITSDDPVQSNPVVPETSNLCLRIEEGQNLDTENKNRLTALLNENEEIFRLGGEPTPYVKHYINTGDHPPVASTPYRLSPKRKELLRTEIDKLLANDVIEECESPFAAPVVLVPKPNGDIRLCIDYRKLNAITVPDKYPLPLMDTLLHDAKSTAFMSTLDLKTGYHQIEVNPDDKDKTAFVCPFGMFRYKRMPFGLKNAPATFQRLMDQFRNGLPTVNILVYLDDIAVLSETFEQHIQDLKMVFDRLRKFNLCVNREKCKFACARVKYLGLWITPKGIEVDQDKVAAIQSIPCPRNVKQLQSFLQTCSWYRKFIPNFSDIARPLSNLTKKNIVWKWSEQEQQAFQTLKQRLVTPPVLRQVDPTKPFIIRTDASGYALGAVLLQGDSPADERPIEYASRLLSSPEKNYSTTEREALAVVWALDKFRGYIEGADITVASDHRPLKWLMTLSSPTGRLASWALQIQTYNLKIDYFPGKCNVVADMLSRPECSDKQTCELQTVVIDAPSRTAGELRTEQLKDLELKKIIDCFEDINKSVDFANWTERGYVLNQGVLYRYSPHSEVEEAQLVVPSHEREKILKLHHDAPTASHYGADGTFSRISSGYYWTGMRKYIADYVKNCAECIRYKATNQKPAGLLQTPVPAQRFESIAIDLFGPLPETSEGMKWIFIVEDCTTKWVELFPLKQATAKECALTLLNEVFLRYGLPRRLISDNGSQFVSAIMQQLCYVLNINQSLIPVYHPQANPVERKNRDLKPRLAMMVGNNHTLWNEQLPAIRFAMNTAKCETTGCTAAYLNFARELRTLDDVTTDLRSVIHNDNFVPEFTPYLKRFERNMSQIKENIEKSQDRRKAYADKSCKPSPNFKPDDLVWVKLHPLSKANQSKSAKLMPRKDGPYVILSQKSPTSFVIASCDKPDVPLGAYHVSALTPFQNVTQNQSPVVPLRRRGRPPNQPSVSNESPGKNAKISKITPPRRDGLRRCRGRM